jgi:hypothetical protein
MNTEPQTPSRSLGRRLFSLAVTLVLIVPAAAAGLYVARSLNVPRIAVVAVLVIIVFPFSHKLDTWAYGRLTGATPQAVSVEEAPVQEADEAAQEPTQE